MAHIALPPDLPGIRGPMTFRPETARPLNELVDVLLRGPHTLSPGERELIATYVSSQNDCQLLPDDPRRDCRASPERQRRARREREARLRARADFRQAQGAARHCRQDRARAASTSRPRTSNTPASAVPPMSKFTTPSSSRRSSACATATWTAWRPGRHRIPTSTGSARRSLRHTATPFQR